MRQKRNQKVMCNISRTRRYLAGHELNPNRGVRPGPHTTCSSVCGHEDSQSPNLRSLAAMYLLHGNTAGAGQHRLIRSAPSRRVDVAVAQNDLPPSCATGPGPIAHPASRLMTSPPPSVTVMIRPAADETTTQDGLPSPFPRPGDFNVCHHVIIVSKPLQSAFFLDVERCSLDGTWREFGMTPWALRAGELALVCL
jgi:hypothetical protein